MGTLHVKVLNTSSEINLVLNILQNNINNWDEFANLEVPTKAMKIGGRSTIMECLQCNNSLYMYPF